MMSKQAIRHISAAELRAEARALLDHLSSVEDPAIKRELAQQALVLVQRAEELQPFASTLEIGPDDPTLLPLLPIRRTARPRSAR